MRFRKVLITYISVYLLIFVLFICVLIPFRNNMQQVARARVIHENQLSVQNGMRQIENQMSKLVQMSSLMCTSQDLIQLVLSTDDTSAIDNTINMLRTKDQIDHFISLLDNVEYCMLTSSKNSIFISDSLVSKNYKEVYGNFLQVGSLTADEYLARLLNSNQSIECQAEQIVKIKDKNLSDNMLIFISHGTLQASMTGLCTFAYFVNADNFMLSILPEILASGGFSIIVNNNGEALTSQGSKPNLTQIASIQSYDTIEIDNERYVIFREVNRALGITLIAGVPELNITENTNLLTRIIPIYLIVGLIVSILLVVSYSVWHYKSVRQLITAGIQLTGIPFYKANGYRYTRKVLKLISDEKDKIAYDYSLLDHAYLNNILNSACIHGVYSQQEIDNLHHYVGELSSFCVVILQYPIDIESSSLLKIERDIKDLLPEYEIIFIHQKPSKSVLIISSQNATSSLIEKVAGVINNVLHDSENGNAGISDCLSGVEMIRLGYQQAGQALRIQNYSDCKSSSTLYKIDDAQMIVFDTSTFIKLSDLIYSGKIDGVIAFFNELKDIAQNKTVISEDQLSELFYILRMIIFNVARELKVNITEPHLRSDIPYIDMLSKLQDIALTLIAEIEAKQKRGSEEMYKKAITVMEKLLEYTALNAACVADHIGCSEKHVFKLIKNWSRKSFGDQLEHLRILKAENLLLTTKLSNEQIAQSAGFTSLSTFYRAFRKAHGVTPASWKLTAKELPIRQG